MAQKLIQTQEQKLQQLQKLSAQQMLQVKLLEMPLTELEDSINAELDDNPALESENPDDMLANDTNENDYLPEDNDSHNNDEEDDYEAQTEKEEREDALDSALENIGRDDLMPDYNSDRNNKQDADYEEMVYGDTISFYDKLKEQMDMQMLDDTEKQIMEYLIGSLDDDGLLRKDLDSICDELAIYQNIDVSEQKLEKILHILQTFDPAGIGARNLQECLLLQVKRMPKGVLRKSMEEVFTDYYDEFTKKHWDKIKTGLELNDTQLATLQEEIRKLIRFFQIHSPVFYFCHEIDITSLPCFIILYRTGRERVTNKLDIVQYAFISTFIKHLLIIRLFPYKVFGDILFTFLISPAFQCFFIKSFDAASDSIKVFSCTFYLFTKIFYFLFRHIKSPPLQFQEAYERIYNILCRS